MILTLAMTSRDTTARLLEYQMKTTMFHSAKLINRVSGIVLGVVVSVILVVVMWSELHAQ